MSHLSMFRVSAGSTQPIYRQIVDQVKRLAAAGQLQAGDRFPSARALASHLGINPMTVSRAVRELTAGGVLRQQRGMGSFVAELGSLTLPNRAKLLAPTLERAAQEAKQLRVPTSNAVRMFEIAMNSGEPLPL